ncbi:MAG TPA: GGDEF domain-containing protein [Planctomycetota bacterium]|nr:GGDEF domain-containing protein [Planctomycetota bacterium]
MRDPVSVREVLGSSGSRTSVLDRPWVALAVGAALVVGIWLVDRRFDDSIRFYAVYLVPICLVAWTCGRTCAGLLAAAALGLWIFGDQEVGKLWILDSRVCAWNVGMRAVTFLAAGLVVAKLRAELERERELARTDQVTGAPNRHCFAEAAASELDRARRYGRPFSVAYLDIDDFKLLNDRQGHDAGDAALRRTAEAIASNLRGSDAYARIGGDEFAILLPEASLEAAREVADRIRQKLLEAAGQAGWPITFTLGVAAFRLPPNSVEEMLRLADELMYEAKKAGKNRIESRAFGG